MTARSTWKARELKAAKLLGGVRGLSAVIDDSLTIVDHAVAGTEGGK